MTLLDSTAARLAALGPAYRIRPDGQPEETPGWRWHSLVKVFLPTSLPSKLGGTSLIREILIHRLLANQVIGALKDLWNSNLWDLFHTFSGSFSIRFIRGSHDTPSVHCWAAALDWNAEMMPLGSDHKWPPKVLEIWNAHGFISGQGWARPDPMHVEARKLFP